MSASSKVRLIDATLQLRRKVYGSYPWGYRVGRLLFGIRYAAEPGAFGRLCYGLFSMHGVQGLPRTDVTPSSVKEIDKLPREYGREFGFKCRNWAAKYLHGSDDDIEELLSIVAVRLLTSPSIPKALDGEFVSRAEGYVLTMIKHSALEKHRSDKVRKHEDIEKLIDEPAKWDDLGKLLPEHEREQLAEELEKAVSPRLMPDLDLYFQLLCDGFSNKEIAEQRMLPSLREKPMSQQGLAKYRTKIQEVLQRHFDVQARVLLTG